eukprot:60330-Rhodomonas_salina.1
MMLGLAAGVASSSLRSPSRSSTAFRARATPGPPHSLTPRVTGRLAAAPHDPLRVRLRVPRPLPLTTSRTGPATYRGQQGRELRRVVTVTPDLPGTGGEMSLRSHWHGDAAGSSTRWSCSRSRQPLRVTARLSPSPSLSEAQS